MLLWCLTFICKQLHLSRFGASNRFLKNPVSNRFIETVSSWNMLPLPQNGGWTKAGLLCANKVNWRVWIDSDSRPKVKKTTFFLLFEQWDPTLLDMTFSISPLCGQIDGAPSLLAILGYFPNHGVKVLLRKGSLFYHGGRFRSPRWAKSPNSGSQITPVLTLACLPVVVFVFFKSFAIKQVGKKMY